MRPKTLLIAACGMIAGLGTVAWAQNQAPPGLAPASATAPVSEQPSAARAARELSRAATLDLQLTGGTRPRDFRVAAILLAIAHDLSPTDETILRLLIDAASSSGDRESLLEYTRQLLRLDPADTVAQLRLISGGISSRQDADSRIEAYERFLSFRDGKGNMLDASIRSRLALDEALLLRERGDLRGFAEKLSTATELDSTNKDAASLAASFFSDESTDAVGRLSLLISLLKADPFDPETHLSIARELAAGEAWDQANRFYRTHATLLAVRGQEVPPAVSAETNVLFWCNKGAEPLVTELRERIEAQRSSIRLQKQYAIEHDAPVDKIPDPDRLRLSPEMERIRAAASLALGEPGQADYAYQELKRTYESEIENTKSPDNFPKGTTDAQRLDRQQRLEGELMWLRLWIGKDLPLAEAKLSEYQNDPTVMANADASAALKRMQGWLQLQKGELDAAEKTLTPLAERDVLAKLALCVLQERRENREKAIEAYAALGHGAAGSVVGAFARTRYAALAGKPLEPLPVAKQLSSMCEAIPGWLEDMLTDPRNAVSLQATLEKPVIGALEPARIRLRLRNVSWIPLAVGPERPINTRLLLVPWLEVGLRPVRETATGSIVLRLDRRLRLLPQEEIDTVVWADMGNMGWLMNRLITAPITVKWKVIQGFTLGAGGVYIAGPNCQSVETEYLQRQPSAKSLDDTDGLIAWLQTGTTEDVAEVMMIIQTRARLKEGNGGFAQDSLTPISQALSTRYPRLDTSARVLVAAMLPQNTAWLKPVEDAIAADTEPMVRVVAIALRVSDPKSQRLAEAVNSGDARLAEMATLVQSRLSDGTRTFSQLGLNPNDAAPGEAETPNPTEGQSGGPH